MKGSIFLVVALVLIFSLSCAREQEVDVEEIYLNSLELCAYSSQKVKGYECISHDNKNTSRNLLPIDFNDTIKDLISYGQYCGITHKFNGWLCEPN